MRRARISARRDRRSPASATKRSGVKDGRVCVEHARIVGMLKVDVAIREGGVVGAGRGGSAGDGVRVVVEFGVATWSGGDDDVPCGSAGRRREEGVGVKGRTEKRRGWRPPRCCRRRCREAKMVEGWCRAAMSKMDEGVKEDRA